MSSLENDLREYQKGDKKALTRKPERNGETKKKPAVTTKSLRRLVKALTEEQRDELRELLVEAEMGYEPDEEDDGDEDE
jgi:hypothetical protein